MEYMGAATSPVQAALAQGSRALSDAGRDQWASAFVYTPGSESALIADIWSAMLPVLARIHD
eukprot:5802108-Alexandrium_andersonii.AAC.1